MKSHTRNLLTLIPVVAISLACVPPNTAPIQPQRTQTIINASKDKVWPIIISEIGLKYPVQALEKESGLITTQFVNMPAGYNNMNMSQWVFEPKGFLATWNGLKMNMRILAVEIEPNKTQITIQCHYEAYENNVSHSWIVAQSNGSIENSVLTKIEQIIATK